MALSLQDVQHDVEHDSSPDDHDLIKGDESLVDDIDLSHHEKENGHSMNHFQDGLDHEHLDGVEDGHDMENDDQEDQVEEQEAHDSDSDPSQEHNENSHNHSHEHEMHNQGHPLGSLSTINGMTNINSMGSMNINNINMNNMSGMHSEHDQYMIPHPNLLPSFPMLLNTQPGALNMSMLTPQQMMGRQFNAPMLSMQQQMGLNGQPNNIQLEHYVPNTEHVVTGVVVGTLDNGSHDSEDEGSSKSNRKQRWRPTQEQRHILDAIWQSNPYPDTQMKQQIVKQFNGTVSYQQVTSWFKHKREKEAKNKFQYKYVPAAKFSTDQVTVLEQAFIGDPYAKGKALQEVSDQLGVPLKRVQNWFKHKRSRLAQQGKFEYKPRNMLDPEQVTFLRGAFFTNPTPAPEICDNISAELGLKPEQVTRWFSNERSRRRKKEQQKQHNREHHSSSKSSKHHNNNQIEPAMQQMNVNGMHNINSMNSMNQMNMAHMNALNQMNMGGMPNPNYGMNPMQVNQSVNMGAINNLSHMNGLNMPSLNMNNINAMAMQPGQHPQSYQFDGVSMHNIANMGSMNITHMNNMNNLGMAVPDTLDVDDLTKYQSQMNSNTPTTTTSHKKKRGRKSKNRMIPIEQASSLMTLPDDGVNQQHETDVQDAEAVVGLPADLVHENMVTVGLQIDPQGK